MRVNPCHGVIEFDLISTTERKKVRVREINFTLTQRFTMKPVKMNNELNSVQQVKFQNVTSQCLLMVRHSHTRFPELVYSVIFDIQPLPNQAVTPLSRLQCTVLLWRLPSRVALPWRHTGASTHSHSRNSSSKNRLSNGNRSKELSWRSGPKRIGNIAKGTDCAVCLPSPWSSWPMISSSNTLSTLSLPSCGHNVVKVPSEPRPCLLKDSKYTITIDMLRPCKKHRYICVCRKRKKGFIK